MITGEISETHTEVMEQKENQPEELQDDVNALESAPDEQVIDATSDSSSSAPQEDLKAPRPKGLKGFTKRFNFYIIIFVFILVMAGVIILIAYFQSKKASTTSTIKAQTLTQQTLDQVANSDATVGDAQQVLKVQSSAIFAGKVLVRQGLEVAGNLQIGGTVGLTNLTVEGTTQLGQVQVNKNFSVAGDTAIQGATTIAKGLQVSGSGSFSGPVSAPQITTSNLQLNSDLTLTHHLIIGGGTPARSNGSALGSGGSASVSGSDTAGTVTINVGGSAAAGCFVTINFTQKFSNTPRVIITPVGVDAGKLDYYITRNNSGFSICDASTPQSGSSFAFDYFAVD